MIDKIYRYFPEQTIFICVVDPGVGSKRELIFIDTGNYKFIGPNNGLFHYILIDPKISYKSWAIKEEFRSVRSTTFHGRDLFTPAAIEIARGNFDIVQPIDKEKLVLIPLLREGASVITYIDGFGNIKTNIPFRDEFKKKDFLKINVNNTFHLIKVFNAFSDASKEELLCYKGSNDTLEIAANLASAEKILNVEVEDSITVEE